MRRREFIAWIGGAAAAPAFAPFGLRAQQAVTPVIGFLHAGWAGAYEKLVGAFTDGLRETGYVDGDTVAIAYQWANDNVGRLPALAAELVRSQVAVLASIGLEPALAAKAATSSIPVVFIASEDPVKLGLVASLAQPGANVTGVDIFAATLTAKRLQMLHTLLPAAARIGVLVNPADAATTAATIRDAQEAAAAIGLQIRALNAATSEDIDATFETVRTDGLDALLVDLTPFFSSRHVQLVNLASSYGIPAVYGWRQFPETGGLMSYGTSIAEAYRQAGVYSGRILNGARPADLPVVQPAKFDLAINLRAAKKLGIDVPPTLLAIADEVIE